jgi:hypothetical protein
MLNLFINSVHAAVSLPDFSSIDNLGVLMQNIFSFSITIVGILIFIRFLYGGFLYLTAAASPGNTSKAKTVMWNSIIGAVILFSAYLILYVINPDLVTNAFNFGGLVNNSATQNTSPGANSIQNFDVNPKVVSISGDTTIAVTYNVNMSISEIQSKCGDLNSIGGLYMTTMIGSTGGNSTELFNNKRKNIDPNTFGTGKTQSFSYSINMGTLMENASTAINNEIKNNNGGYLNIWGEVKCSDKDGNMKPSIYKSSAIQMTISL